LEPVTASFRLAIPVPIWAQRDTLPTTAADRNSKIGWKSEDVCLFPIEDDATLEDLVEDVSNLI
jgi:hypothetical protein